MEDKLKIDTDDQFQKAFEKSLEVVQQMLESEIQDDWLVKKNRVATATISAYTRMLSTRSSRERTGVMFGKLLAQNKEQLGEFVKAAFPQSPMAKMLEVPKTSEKGGWEHKGGELKGEVALIGGDATWPQVSRKQVRRNENS